jgi:hypothetical protein
MYELRRLRLAAGPEHTLERFARYLNITAAELDEQEKTPIELLTIGDVAFYLDVLGLEVEVRAFVTGSTPFQQRLIPDPEGLLLYDPTSMSEEVQLFEEGGWRLPPAPAEGDSDERKQDE